MNQSPENRMEQAVRAVFETYVLDLMRVLAAAQEDAHRENRGHDYNILIREVELAGEYPKTSFKIQTYDRVRDLEQTVFFPLYKSEFFDENGRRTGSPEDIVSYTLMWARGG